MQVMEATQLFTRAEQAGCDPDQCAAGRWQCYMLQGAFEDAWRESDAIAVRGHPDCYRFWDGSPVTGKSVLIRCLHGLGDTLQFVRYVPLLRKRARTVTVEAQPAMKTLLEMSGIADRVITWGEQEPFWDQQIEIIELPRVFRTNITTIPRNVPYINLPNKAVASAQGNLRVVLNWAASAFNPCRSMRLEQLRPIFEQAGVSFVSVQAGPERRDLGKFRHKVLDAYDDRGCILSAALTVARADLVITVDTMMAHLAGALGKPVWTLLPFQCDWRWMLNRKDSPWYPTMRLFRQSNPGAWEPVVMQVAEELATMAARSKVDTNVASAPSSREPAPAG